jgi:hypothetical protein
MFEEGQIKKGLKTEREEPKLLPLPLTTGVS